MTRSKAKPGKKARFEPIRWTIERAASEFGLNPRTVAKDIKTAGIVPGPDKKFSTADIHSAICGDYERERIRKLREDADKVALENAHSKKILVDVSDLLKRFEVIFVAMKQHIMSSGLSDKDKDALCAHIASLRNPTVPGSGS